MIIRGLWRREAIALSLCAIAANSTAQTFRRHDAARARTAAAAVEAFAAADSQVFETMLANIDAVDERDRELIHQQNEAKVASTIANLPGWTWGRFAANVATARNDFQTAFTAALQVEGAGRENVASFSDALASARQAAAAEQKRLTEAEAEISGRLATVEQFDKAVDEVLKVGDVATLADLQKLKKLPSSVERLVDNARASGNAQGLRLTLLRLGRDLARADVELAREDLRMTRWSIDHSKALIERVTTVDAQLDALAAFAASQPAAATIAETIRTAAEAAQADASRETAVAQQLANLAVYTAAVGYETAHLNEWTVAAESERLRSSIRKSKINLGVDAALVRHGLGGLQSYYEGGLRPADLANLFRALQTIALGVIAGAN